MADQNKGKQFYELTREKPFGIFHMVLVGGTAFAVVAFLIVSLIGAYEGLSMDSIILSFLVTALLGFVLGGLLTWLAIRYIGPIIDETEKNKIKESTDELKLEPTVPTEITEPIVEGDEKGQSVDFVFPEISPGQQG